MPKQFTACYLACFLSGWGFCLPSLAADPSDDVFDIENLSVKLTALLPYVEAIHDGRKVLIMRHQDPEHKIVAPFDETSRNCPPFCIQPMQLAPGLETIGELELLDYLRRTGKDNSEILVIDSRTPDWIMQGTIPGATNIPFTRLDPEHTSFEEIAELLEFEFGAIRQGELWNFISAKTLVFFCNGPWCGQSPTSIRMLLSLGYPAHKIKWYRGGIQAWEQFGLTTVKPEFRKHN